MEARFLMDAAKVTSPDKVSATATGAAGVISALLPIVWARYAVKDGWPELGAEVWGPIAVGLLVLGHKLVTRLELAADRRFALKVLAAGFYPLGPIPPDKPEPEAHA